jgi:acyl-CoA thioesterase-2
VSDKLPHSLHAYFVEAGTPEAPLELVVDRVRDGRSVSTRRVTVVQGSRPLSSSWPRSTRTRSTPRSPVRHRSCRARRAAPAPRSVRDVPASCGGTRSTGRATTPGAALARRRPSRGRPDRRCSHWMRPPRAVGDDPVLYAPAWYASDYLLLDMAFRLHPENVASTQLTASASTTRRFHRPVRFDRWHLHTRRRRHPGHRGLVRVRSTTPTDASWHRGARGADPPTRKGDPVMTSFEYRLYQQPWPEGEYRLFQSACRRRRPGDGCGHERPRYRPFHVLPDRDPCTDC